MDGTDRTEDKREVTEGLVAGAGFLHRGGWWVVGQSLLMVGVVLGGVWDREQWVSATTFLAGWVVLTAGGFVGVLGVVHLGKARTAFPRPLRGMRLVTSGLYAWVRHPLYVSVVTASVGWALIWASVWALGLAVVLGFYLNAKAAREEQWLRAVYPEYGSYAQRVKRWLPGVY